MIPLSPTPIVSSCVNQNTVASTSVPSTGSSTETAAAQFKSSITRERLEEVSFQCEETNILATLCTNSTATRLIGYWNVVHTPVTIITFVFQLLLQVALLTNLVWVQYACLAISPFAMLWYLAFVARLNAHIFALMMKRFEFVFPVTHLCCALVAGIVMYNDNWLKRLILVQYIAILSSGLLTDAAVVATRVRMFPATTAAAMVVLYLSPAQHVFLNVGFLPRHINVTLFFVDRLLTLQIFALRVLYTHWNAPTEFGTLRVSLEKLDVVTGISPSRGSIEMPPKAATQTQPSKAANTNVDNPHKIVEHFVVASPAVIAPINAVYVASPAVIAPINAVLVARPAVIAPITAVFVRTNMNTNIDSKFLVSVSITRLEEQAIVGDEELDILAVLFGRKHSAMLAHLWAPVSPVFIFGTLCFGLGWPVLIILQNPVMDTVYLCSFFPCMIWVIVVSCRMHPGTLLHLMHSFEYLFLLAQIVCVAVSGFIMFDRTIDRMGVMGVCLVAMVIQSFDAVRTKSRARSSMSAVIGAFPWLVVGVYCYLVHPSVFAIVNQ